MRHALKLSISLLLAISLVFGSIAFAAAADAFSDISGHWANGVINKWAGRGVITGYPDGTFIPDRFITRAEMAGVYASLLKIKGDGKSSFKDIVGTEWFYQIVDACNEGDIVNGYPDGNYKPMSHVIRQDAFIIDAAALGVLPRNVITLNELFSDGADVSAYARSWTQGLVDEEIAGGYPDGTMRPLRNITRAELVQILEMTISQYIDQPGTYEAKDGDRIIIVASDDVIIKGEPEAVVISGGVDGGTVIIEDAEVSNSVIIYAEDAEVIIKDSEVGGVKITGTADDTEVIIINSQTGDIKDMGEDTTITIEGSDVGDITITEDAEKAKVIITDESQTGDIYDDAPQSEIVVEDGSDVGTIELQPSAEEAKVDIEPGTHVTEIIIDAPDTTIDVRGDVDEITGGDDGDGSVVNIYPESPVTERDVDITDDDDIDVNWIGDRDDDDDGPGLPSDPRTPEDIQAEVDAIMEGEGSTMNVYIKSEVIVNAASSAKVGIKNNNTFPVTVVISVDGTNVFEQVIAAGESLTNVILPGLTAGVHPGIATFTAASGSSVSLNITVKVL